MKKLASLALLSVLAACGTVPHEPEQPGAGPGAPAPDVASQPLRVPALAQLPETPVRPPAVSIGERKNPAPVDLPVYSEDQYVKVLRLIAKFGPEDEINCGGCGYAGCAGYGEAIALKGADPTLCAPGGVKVGME